MKWKSNLLEEIIINQPYILILSSNCSLLIFLSFSLCLVKLSTWRSSNSLSWLHHDITNFSIFHNWNRSNFCCFEIIRFGLLSLFVLVNNLFSWSDTKSAKETWCIFIIFIDGFFFNSGWFVFNIFLIVFNFLFNMSHNVFMI